MIRRVLPAAGLLALVLSACSDLGPTGEGLAAEIAAHRALWEERRPSAYVYEVERVCFCPVEARGPVRVRVRDAQVLARAYVATGAPVSGELERLFPGVEGLFDVLEDAVARNADQIRVEWDLESGAPLDLWIDYDGTTADEEQGFRIVAEPRPDPAS